MYWLRILPFINSRKTHIYCTKTASQAELRHTIYLCFILLYNWHCGYLVLDHHITYVFVGINSFCIALSAAPTKK